MAKKRTNQPTQINDEALDDVKGGVLIGLLLPAVQKSPNQATITDGTSISDGTSNLTKVGPGTLNLSPKG